MTRALVVDDSATDRRLAGRLLEKSEQATPIYASNGVEALSVLESETPDVIVTDLQMPEMNGLELVGEIRSRYPGIPVILMTAFGSEEIAVEALEAGAASYVPKRNLPKDLARTVEFVLGAAEVGARKHRVLEQLTHAEFAFRCDNDPANIRPLVTHLQDHLVAAGLRDQAEQIQVGTAIHEALTNAVFHGNLEVNSALREEGNGGEDYFALAESRRTQPPYCGRSVHVSAKFTPSVVVIAIRDEGPGFDPSTLPDPTDPANLVKASGRGLLLIQAFMDEVAHSDTGNEITMTKRTNK